MGLAMVKHIEPSTSGGGRLAVQPVGKIIAMRARDPWREATECARSTALQRETVVAYVHQKMAQGVSQNNAVAEMLSSLAAGTLAKHYVAALQGAARKKRAAPSGSVIKGWSQKYREGGLNALLPGHKGRVVDSAAWYGPALEYFNQPSKPDMAAVHRQLVEVDGFTVSYDQVRSYLNSVPAMYGRYSPARLGRNLYRLTEKAYIKRSTANALPGDVYVADGYRADVYLAHPVTGDLWRPELTVIIDLRSRVVVHWRADEHEGTYAVQNTWAEAFARWNHVPPFIYVDNGSGYKNALMSDASTGFYARAGVQQIIHAIPGNPHGKGWVERTFRIVKDDFLRLWAPAFYCGDEMADEVRNRVVREVKAGRLQLPTLADFAQAFNAWLVRHHSRPHPENKHVTRAELWAQLVPLPPHANVTELKRQAVTLTVRRGGVQHGKRLYRHPELLAFNGQELVLEYDLMDDGVAVIRMQDGRWVCDAHLVRAMDAIAPNRLEEKRQARAADAMKRLKRKMVEQEARAGYVIDVEAVAMGARQALPVPDVDDDELLLDLELDDNLGDEE